MMQLTPQPGIPENHTAEFQMETVAPGHNDSLFYFLNKEPRFEMLHIRTGLPCVNVFSVTLPGES